jgi:riboflavin transporter FmnP
VTSLSYVLQFAVLLCVLTGCFPPLFAVRGNKVDADAVFIDFVSLTTSFIIVPSVVYQLRKGLKSVCLTLVFACVFATAIALLTNRYINFPLYMGAGAATAFQEFYWIIVAFNLIKTASISILTILLYKRLSNFLKKIKI